MLKNATYFVKTIVLVLMKTILPLKTIVQSEATLRNPFIQKIIFLPTEPCQSWKMANFINLLNQRVAEDVAFNPHDFNLEVNCKEAEKGISP